MRKNNAVLTILTVLGILFSSFIPVSGQAEQPPEAEESIMVEEINPDTNLVILRVYYKDRGEIEGLLAYDLLEYNNREEQYVLVIANQRDIERIKAQGYEVAIDEELTQNYEELYGGSEYQLESIPGYTCYRTVEETYAAAQNIANNYPNIASWVDVGNSWEKSVGQPDGYDMLVLVLTNKSLSGPKPVVFMTGAIHAREYTTAELLTRYAEYLVGNYNNDPDVTWLIDHHEIHLMLQTNPDGRKEAEAGASWRKNTNENYCGVTSSNRGADLNRNFEYQWGTGGSSSNPCDATYMGPSRGSEPETQAVTAYMDAVFEDQRGTGAAPADAMGLYLDIHSAAGMVIWPWGYSYSTAPNHSQMQTLGRKFSYYNGYEPGQITDLLYVASGGSVDYSYGELGIASFAFELGREFFESCSYFESTVYPENLEALIYAAKVARTPYMTPAGPDAVNVAVSEGVVYEGESVTLTAEINDTRYSTRNGAEATQNVVGAEFYVDTPYWEAGATSLTMSAVDGTYNETIEEVSFTINTSGWSQGRHTLFVRGQDAAGNWGAVSAVFLTVEDSDNEPPTADNLVLTTDEDVAVTVELTGSDPDGDTLTFGVVETPTNGTLSGAVPNLVYTPNENYFGTDSFTYSANDGIADSPIATVTISITAVDDLPVADNITMNLIVNSSTWLSLPGYDVDGDPLTFDILNEPQNGILRGNAPDLLYSPNKDFLGIDSFVFNVSDGNRGTDEGTVTIEISNLTEMDVFYDDFEMDKGWVINPNGSDTATTGMWERAIPEAVSGTQLGTPISGDYDLVTGHLAGSGVGSYDIDNGMTSIRSPEIDLPPGYGFNLSLYFYLSHYDNSTSDDFFRVSVVGESTQRVFEELGAGNTDEAVWDYLSVDISNFAGQRIYLLIEAGDAGSPSLVEAAVDDIHIVGNLTNAPPSARNQSISLEMNNDVDIVLDGEDVENDPLSFEVVVYPSHGSLMGSVPNLVYTPDAGYVGGDIFEFVALDALSISLPGVVSLDIFSPTSVDILSFMGELLADGIELRWETANELNNLGFNLYRSRTSDGIRELVNEELISTQAPPGSPNGGVYTYLDKNIGFDADVYYYWLEEVDISGQTDRYGPIWVEINLDDEELLEYKTFIPLIIR